MAHSHGSEFQVKVVHQGRIEELSGWMNNEAQAMAPVNRPHAKLTGFGNETLSVPTARATNNK
jgi:hypothetical protein